ncbi:MAG: type II and III secretion system protein family protein [Lacipirellulaceae bacterium]
MYDLSSVIARLGAGFSVLGLGAALAFAPTAAAQMVTPNGSVVRKIEGSGDQLEITTNTSRILTLDKKIPRVQVNNPDLLVVTPLSATQVQISAKKAGVTQVNLWDEDGQIHTVDVFIYGDVRELENALKTQFPNSSVRVYRYSQSLVLTGFIDRPDYVDPIRQLAEDYAPKVINNISVGGVQQVLLKVKIYEISRTKLRQMGSDFAFGSSNGGYFGTSVSGLLNTIGSSGGVTAITDTGGQTVEFAITDGGDSFTAFFEALQRDNIAKILAEPNIVAVSGRPAQFNEGGEVPILIPQGLGQIAIEYKPYGTQVDFLPIVLGNGKIRLEVRPRISEIDDSRAVQINDTSIPALTVRQVDTAVEMRAGQTFAIAGLIQQRTEAARRGIPWLMDLPYIGVPFRSVADETNEIELLILVTPEFVDAMEPHEVPTCGPGLGTVTPNDCDLYMKGTMEVPDTCSPCANGGCGSAPCVSGGIPTAPGNFYNGAGAGAPHGHGMPHEGSAVPAISPMGEPTPADGLYLEPTSAAPDRSGAQKRSVAMRNGPSLAPAGADRQFQSNAAPTFERQAVQPYRPAPAAWTGDAELIGPVGYDAD